MKQPPFQLSLSKSSKSPTQGQRYLKAVHAKWKNKLLLSSISGNDI